MLDKIKTDKGKAITKVSLDRFVQNMQQNIIVWIGLFLISSLCSAFVLMLMSPQFAVNVGTMLAVTATANNQSFEMAYAVFAMVVTIGLHIIVMCVGAITQWGNTRDDEEFDTLLKEKVTLIEMIEWCEELSAQDRAVLASSLSKRVEFDAPSETGEWSQALKAS